MVSTRMTPQEAAMWGNSFRLLSRMLDEIGTDWKSDPVGKFKNVNDLAVLKNPKSFNWASLYELPVPVYLLFLGLLLWPPIASELLASKFPQLHPLAYLKRLPFGSHWIRKRVLNYIVPAVITYYQNIQSHLVHGQTINQLMRQVQNPEGDDALFDIIGIDPAAICARPIATRIRRAAAERDRDFLKRLGNKLRDPGKPEDRRDTSRLHSALWLMSATGRLHLLKSKDMAYEIFSVRSRLYETIESNSSAPENLWKLVKNHQKKQGKNSAEKNPRRRTIV